MKQTDINRLQKNHEYPSVSIFLPTHKSIPEKLQDHIRVNNLIKQAIDRLHKEFSAHDLTQIIAQLHTLSQNIDYIHMQNGLAIFANAHMAKAYKLPFPMKERVVIDKNFETRELIYNLNRSPQYWVLSLSKKMSRLYHGTENMLIEEITPLVDEYGQGLSGFPLNYLGPDETESFALGSGDRDAAYLTEQKQHFFQMVDTFLTKTLQENPLPVILLGEKRDLIFFGSTTKNKDHIIITHEGNYDHIASHDLAQLTWALMQKSFTFQQKELLNKLQEAQGHGRYAFSLKPIWVLAQEGRVFHLLVEEDYHVAGTINPQDNTQLALYENAEAPDISEDLIDHLINLVLLKKGKVTFFSQDALKNHDHIAAILRY